MKAPKITPKKSTLSYILIRVAKNPGKTWNLRNFDIVNKIIWNFKT